MELADVAQKIAQHASTGPAQTPGQKVRNILSPHFERLVIELIRAHVIKSVQKAEASVTAEFAVLKALNGAELQNSFEQSCARINEELQSIYK